MEIMLNAIFILGKTGEEYTKGIFREPNCTNLKGLVAEFLEYFFEAEHMLKLVNF